MTTESVLIRKFFDPHDSWTTEQIRNVRWNYGTDQDPVPIPSPGGALLGILGLALVGLRRRRLA